MSEDHGPGPGPGALDRLDLALAQRLSGAAGAGAGGALDDAADGEDVVASAQGFYDVLYRGGAGDAGVCAALLRLRGFAVHDEDAAEVLAGGGERLPPSSQEHQLVRGLCDALHLLRDRSSRGQLPDGWFLVELYKVATRGVRRFRNNALRSDPPWDGVLYVPHPAPAELPALLDTFDAGHSYRDHPAVFASLHPVRQSFRVLWRFARLAPFPDLNLPMAWLAMCGHLLAKGYPLLVPEPSDRELVLRLVSGPPPLRMTRWEARLLATVSA